MDKKKKSYKTSSVLFSKILARMFSFAHDVVSKKNQLVAGGSLLVHAKDFNKPEEIQTNPKSKKNKKSK